MGYRRAVQPLPKLGPFQARLDALLEEDEARPRREKLRLTRIHDLLLREGFDGSYDAVRRYAARWRQARRRDVMDAPAFIPLLFRPGEAYQFDWSHEDVEISGKPMRVKVAHVRLCASRTMYVRAYPRETQEMLFDAHARAFAFFGGVPTRGIYDNMKTAVTSVFTGKERVFNRRFLVMANHYMVEPTACSPACRLGEGSGREPGADGARPVLPAAPALCQPRGAERLAGGGVSALGRDAPASRAEGTDGCPGMGSRAQAVLQPVVAPFDGFHESEHAVSGTCLISFDRNRYSGSWPRRWRDARCRFAPMPTASSCAAMVK